MGMLGGGWELGGGGLLAEGEVEEMLGEVLGTGGLRGFLELGDFLGGKLIGEVDDDFGLAGWGGW
jgi:formylmethanofuran dehydrogenase subunit C